MNDEEQVMRSLFLCSTTMLKKIIKLPAKENHDIPEATLKLLGLNS